MRKFQNNSKLVVRGAAVVATLAGFFYYFNVVPNAQTARTASWLADSLRRSSTDRVDVNWTIDRGRILIVINKLGDVDLPEGEYSIRIKVNSQPKTSKVGSGLSN